MEIERRELQVREEHRRAVEDLALLQVKADKRRAASIPQSTAGKQRSDRKQHEPESRKDQTMSPPAKVVHYPYAAERPLSVRSPGSVQSDGRKTLIKLKAARKVISPRVN